MPTRVLPSVGNVAEALTLERPVDAEMGGEPLEQSAELQASTACSMAPEQLHGEAAAVSAMPYHHPRVGVVACAIKLMPETVSSS